MGDKINEKIEDMAKSLRQKLEAFMDNPSEQLRGDIAWAMKAYQEFVDNVKVLVE